MQARVWLLTLRTPAPHHALDQFLSSPPSLAPQFDEASGSSEAGRLCFLEVVEGHADRDRDAFARR